MTIAAESKQTTECVGVETGYEHTALTGVVQILSTDRCQGQIWEVWLINLTPPLPSVYWIMRSVENGAQKVIVAEYTEKEGAFALVQGIVLAVGARAKNVEWLLAGAVMQVESEAWLVFITGLSQVERLRLNLILWHRESYAKAMKNQQSLASLVPRRQALHQLIDQVNAEEDEKGEGSA